MHFLLIILIGVLIWRLLKGGGVTSPQVYRGVDVGLKVVAWVLVGILLLTIAGWIIQRITTGS